MTDNVSLQPEPWTFHLLGLISPLLVISGNILGVYDPIYAAMGVIFIWVVGPILDVLMGETEVPRPPRESGTPFEILLWVHGLLQLVVMASFFWFAYNTGLNVWLIIGHFPQDSVLQPLQSLLRMNWDILDLEVQVGGYPEYYYSV